MTWYPCKIGGVEQVYPNVRPGTPKYANAAVEFDVIAVVEGDE